MFIKLTQTDHSAKVEGRIQHRDAYVDPDHIAAMYPANDGTVLHIAGQLSILRVNEHVTEIIRAIEAARQPPAKDDLCVDCGARFWRGEACVCAPAPAPTSEEPPTPAAARPEVPVGQGRLRLEFEVYRDDGGPLPKAREIGNGITEGLPSEWFEAQDGDDFYLGDSTWTAEWVGGVYR